MFSTKGDDKYYQFLIYKIISCTVLALIQLPTSVSELLPLYTINSTHHEKKNVPIVSLGTSCCVFIYIVIKVCLCLQ